MRDFITHTSGYENVHPLQPAASVFPPTKTASLELIFSEKIENNREPGRCGSTHVKSAGGFPIGNRLKIDLNLELTVRTIPCLLLMSLAVFAGCQSGESDPAATNSTNTEAAAKPISLEPADLEKLASWEETSKANAKLTEMLAEVMASVKDTESAEAAIAKLRDLAPKFAAVNVAEKAFGDPTKEDQKLVLKNLAAAHEKFNVSYTALGKNEDLKAIVSQAIDDAYVGNVTE